MQLPNPLKASPFVQKLQWTSNQIKFLEEAARQYPDIFSAYNFIARQTSVFIYHPQAIQEVFANSKKKFVAISNEAVRITAGDNSLFVQTGKRHQRQRQLLMPPFHGERMRSYGQLICELTTKIMGQLPLNQPISAFDITQNISLQVILQAVFGLYKGERYEKLQHLLILRQKILPSKVFSSFLFFPVLRKDLGAWSPWGKFMRIAQQIDQLLYTEIAERRVQPNSERIDILSLMMEAFDEQGQPMTDQELRDQLLTLLAAGFISTATAMSRGLYWTHHLPEVGRKLRTELKSLGDSPDPISIFRLPYLTAVCNEILRIYPFIQIMSPSMVQEPVELLGYLLEPGTLISPCVYLTHQREDLYPQPQQFRPERFLERQYSPYEFFPFGGGVRRCIGEALAVFEIKLVLATILSHNQLVLLDAQPEQFKFESMTRPILKKIR